MPRRMAWLPSAFWISGAARCLRQAPENHFLHRNGEKYEVFAITMEDSSFCSFLGLISAQSLM
jgi:hypothetical protein